MVGCAAGTTKNVWCSISDRHRRFGHNAPLTAAGDFKRLYKAVAAVKGALLEATLPCWHSPLAAALGAHRSHRVPVAGCFGLCDGDRAMLPCCRSH